MPDKRKTIPTKDVVKLLRQVQQDLDEALSERPVASGPAIGGLLRCERRLVDLIDDVVDADFTFAPPEKRKRKS